MNDLIEALTIISKYLDKESYRYKCPIHCEHDVMCVSGDWEFFSTEDKRKLEKLGFLYSDEYNCIISYRFGSA